MGIHGITLVCSLTGFYPKSIKVTWEEDGTPLTHPLVEKKFQDVHETGETYSQTSQLEVNTDKWLSGSVYTCKATHDSKQFQSSTSICSGKL